MEKKEAILYAYSLDDEFRKSLLSVKICNSMKKLHLENTVDDIEVAFLRGMLEATERKVLYLQQKLNEQKSAVMAEQNGGNHD